MRRLHQWQFITALVSVLAILFSVPSAASSLVGDVDADGCVSSADARLALRAAVKLEPIFPGDAAFRAADYDGDGSITSADARLILRASVGLEPPRRTEGSKSEELTLTIGNTIVAVVWEDNESVSVLKELVKEKPLTIQASMYGGFEQVGPLGTSLPANDAQTVTQPGDIVLYAGDRIVVFYGSNSWAYTRLGHITDRTAAQLKDLLGSGDVTLTLSVE